MQLFEKLSLWQHKLNIKLIIRSQFGTKHMSCRLIILYFHAHNVMFRNEFQQAVLNKYDDGVVRIAVSIILCDI